MAQATLNGIIIDDGGLPCEMRFQWGKTMALGRVTPWGGGWLRTGDTFSQTITGLAGNTIYYFRAEVRNDAGFGIVGSTLFFITTKGAVPQIQTLAATLVTEYSARLNALVVDDGDEVGAVAFEYGPTTAYGQRTGWVGGYETGDSPYSDITGLAMGTGYHFRAIFAHSPVVYGNDMVFNTLSPETPPVFIQEELIFAMEDGR